MDSLLQLCGVFQCHGRVLPSFIECMLTLALFWKGSTVFSAKVHQSALDESASWTDIWIWTFIWFVAGRTPKPLRILELGVESHHLSTPPSSPMWGLELSPESSLTDQWNQWPQPALAALLTNQRSSLLALPVRTCTAIVELRLNSSRQRRATGAPQTC